MAWRSGLVCVLLLLLAACGRKSGEAGTKDEAAATPVKVAEAQVKNLQPEMQAEAVLYPLKQATVVPKISAPVARFPVQRGDRVKAGQVVAILESKDLAAAAAESHELYRQAEANFENTKSATMPDDLTRARSDVRAATETLDASDKVYQSRVKLYNDGALAQKLVEDAKVARVAAQSALDTAKQHLESLQSVGQVAQLRAAQAQVEAANAHYQSSAAQFSYAEVRSPIDGIVSDRPLNVGEMANSGSALLTIVDVSRVVARANVPVQAASGIHVGEAATIANGSGSELTGKVLVVSPAVDPNTTTVQVWVEAANPGQRQKLGSTVRIRVKTEAIPNALVIPMTALLPGDEGGEKVMLALENSTAHEQAVEVGVRAGDLAQITSGLKVGDKVIVSGGLGLEDGAKIRIGDAEEKPSGKSEQ